MSSSSYKYERLPTSPDQPADLKRRTSREEPTSDLHELHRRLAEDPRFNPPTPSAWQRVALIVFMIALLWIGFRMRASVAAQQPKVVHASRSTMTKSVCGGLRGADDRYSKEYKFRPAASPIITERLKDGRSV
ncbi:hypothetical protein OH77DRAFT_1512527 [Trametes cingulata]|nr:hypothetical protein OH77DRAFT_1512527 [Trametes cingulata]